MAEYQAGQTMKAIAAKHGIHRVTVSAIIKHDDASSAASLPPTSR